MSKASLSKLNVGDKVGKLTILEVIPGRTENGKEIPKRARIDNVSP